MLGRVVKRAAMMALAGVGLTLASCSSTGFAGAVYMSPDSDGKRYQSVFFADYAETQTIFFIVPMVSGKNDESLNVYIKVRSIVNDPIQKGSAIFNPILVSSVAPGVTTKPTNVAVQFPDPTPIKVENAADPLNPLTVQPPRAVGKFQFIASMNGDTEAVNFEIIPGANPSIDPTPTSPPAGACQIGDPPQGNVSQCPQPTDLYTVQCCTAAQTCGIGVANTGICF